MQHGEVKIVDEFTGRILEGRRWSEGLHQAVEAKEGVKIKEENQTLATITLQNYFRLYDKLAGMTGTAETEAAELASTYDLQVVPIPTNRPMVRIDQADLIYKTEDAKFDAVVDDIEERYETGQPVLVGTISVEKSEKLSRALDQNGHPPRGAQRQAAHPGGRDRRPGRSARTPSRWPPTWPVAASTSCSAATPRGWPAVDVHRRGPRPRDADEGQTRLDGADRPSSRPSSKAEGDKVREVGGLYVLGTERHESRRIDNQLRGRSGRQGDPGESRFYLSLEDELMRLFATGAMNWVMGKALPDDVPIEAKMVDQGHRAGPEHRRAAQRRDPQERAQVRRGDERAAQGDLQAPRPDPRRRRPARRGHGVPGRGRRRHHRHLLRRATSPRSGTSTACMPELPAYWPAADHRRPAPGLHQHRRDLRAAHGRGHGLLRGPRGRARRRDHARDRAPGDAADHRPALARAPLRDGLPAGGHQPAGHGPEGSAGRVAARGLRDVRRR